jgi:pimeloyl-ACP methyl ester carboxylesterase
MQSRHTRSTITRVGAMIALLSALTSGVTRAQELACKGGASFQAADGSSTGDIHLTRTQSGEWKLVHSRIGMRAVDHASTVVMAGSNLTVGLDELQSSYRGILGPNEGRMRGVLLANGIRVPLDLRCSVVKPPPPDSAAHKTLFVQVEPNITLEVLDWGGTGRPVILLHGMAADAHAFDGFAPKLIADYHVYAISRRGTGRSSVPDTGYASDRLGDDVLAVMDSLHIVRPVLVGHSFGGAQLSSVGSRYPQSVAGLVYLDAAYLYAYFDKTRADPFGLSNPGGLQCPCTMVEKLNLGMRAYRRIPAPVLAIYAMGADWDVTDKDGYGNGVQAAEFERGVPGARVVRISSASHAVWESNEAQVLSEMRAFINGLPGTTHK